MLIQHAPELSKRKFNALISLGVVLGLALTSLTAPPAAKSQEAETISLTDASFLWGVNSIYQGSSTSSDGCNYFSAGTQEGFVAQQDDVQIVQETTNGLIPVSDATKCTGESTTDIKQRVLFTKGTGTANPSTGQAEISWEGGFTANAYSGMVPWWLKDLKLTVAENGSGTLTATAGGWSAQMSDPNEKTPVVERNVTVASFSSVTVTENGIDVKPDYKGVEITVPETVGASPQNRTNEGWGGWPQSFVDFHFDTNLSSYWYSSGLSGDRDKVPFSFSTNFTQPPAVQNLPIISKAPELKETTRLVNGRTATVYSEITNADTIAWERSNTANPFGEYTAIDGQNSEELSFLVTSEWNGRYARVVATNSNGSVTSSPVYITTRDYAAPSFSTQPKDITAFADSPAIFTATVAGFPALDAELHKVEISADNGERWSALDEATSSGTTTITYTIPSVTPDMDGALIRTTAQSTEGAAAGSEGSLITSDAVTLTVLPIQGDGPQLAVVNQGEVDPTQATTLTVIGAGYSIPTDPIESYLSWSVDLALFDTDEWRPGEGGLTRVDGTRYSPNTWIGGGAIYRLYLDNRGGTFSIQVTIPAGTLDPNKNYGIGTYNRLYNVNDYSNTWDDRSNDQWTPIYLLGTEPATITSQPESAELPSEGETVRFEIGVSGSPEPSIDWQLREPGTTEWVSIAGANNSVLEFGADEHAVGTEFRAVIQNRSDVLVTSDVVSLKESDSGTPSVEDLTETNRGNITVPTPASPGSTVTIESLTPDSVVDIAIFPGTTVYHAETVDDSGNLSITLPSEITGTNTIAVYEPNKAGANNVIGWGEIQISDEIVPGGSSSGSLFEIVAKFIQTLSGSFSSFFASVLKGLNALLGSS